jgi:2-polyprenyl-3-methyl-5-hydroxy-6-metoxy-1,4-benzoquinol methylase
LLLSFRQQLGVALVSNVPVGKTNRTLTTLTFKMDVLNSHHGCPACGSPETPEPIYRKAGYQILRCVTCGLGSTALDDRFDPVSLYSADYFQGNQADGYADYVGSESVLRREFRNVVRSLIHHGRTRGRLFEIGCAYGFFLLEARKHFEVHGIEVAADAAEHCRSQGLDVATGIETDECMARRGPFDIVVMLDVIEHLQNPLEVLKIASSNLNSGGHILISTGDWDSVLSRLMGSAWRLMTPPQHLFFFSQKTIQSILSRAGFRVVQISRPAKFVPLSLALFQFTRMVGLRSRTVSSLGRWALPINLFDAMRVIAVKM